MRNPADELRPQLHRLLSLVESVDERLARLEASHNRHGQHLLRHGEQLTRIEDSQTKLVDLLSRQTDLLARLEETQTRQAEQTVRLEESQSRQVKQLTRLEEELCRQSKSLGNLEDRLADGDRAWGRTAARGAPGLGGDDRGPREMRARDDRVADAPPDEDWRSDDGRAAGDRDGPDRDDGEAGRRYTTNHRPVAARPAPVRRGTQRAVPADAPPPPPAAEPPSARREPRRETHRFARREDGRDQRPAIESGRDERLDADFDQLHQEARQLGARLNALIDQLERLAKATGR